MSIHAFAITHHGSLLVDTVRSSEGEAKNAAIKIARTPGTNWRNLQTRGFDLVEVVISPRPRPRPTQGGSARVLAAARERLATRTEQAPADLQPVRKLLEKRSP